MKRPRLFRGQLAAPALRAALAAVAIALAPAAIAPAAAQAFGNPVLRAEILPGWETAQGTRIAALRIEMAEGWHTYWRIPGEAGIAPRFDWGQSQNVAAITPLWPRPEVFRQNGLTSFGYENELILPLEITPTRPGRAMALMGEITVGVCRDACVPVDLSVRGALRGAGDRDPRITGALAMAPETGESAGLTRTICRLEPASRGADLTLRATLPPVGASEQIIVELPGTGYWVSDSRTWREGRELVAQARVRGVGREAIAIDRASLAFTVLSEDRMVSARGCVGG